MGSLNVSGVLQGQNAETSLSAAVFNAPLGLRNASKSFASATGVLRRVIASPAAFVSLSGIGGDVATANFFYFRTTAAMTLRITHSDGAGGSVVVSIPVHGLFIFELPDTNVITLAEVQGSGEIEYFASGP